MAPTGKRVFRGRLSSPSDSARRISSSPRVPASPLAQNNSPLVQRKNSVPFETRVALLRILNGPDEYMSHKQIYDQNQFLFGEPDSVLRKKVANHCYYLEILREKSEEKFNLLCEAHEVAVRAADQEDSGDPFAPLTTMSGNYRNPRK